MQTNSLNRAAAIVCLSIAQNIAKYGCNQKTIEDIDELRAIASDACACLDGALSVQIGHAQKSTRRKAQMRKDGTPKKKPGRKPKREQAVAENAGA